MEAERKNLIMRTTREVIAALRDANPNAAVTEEGIRHALRRGDVPRPTSFAGRLAWTNDEIHQLAQVLGLRAPKACGRAGQ